MADDATYLYNQWYKQMKMKSIIKKTRYDFKILYVVRREEDYKVEIDRQSGHN